MSRVKPLHRVLAQVIQEQLTVSWTSSNCIRYLTHDVLVNYCIKRETPITIADWNTALSLAREQRAQERQKPNPQPNPGIAKKELSMEERVARAKAQFTKAKQDRQRRIDQAQGAKVTSLSGRIERH